MAQVTSLPLEEHSLKGIFLGKSLEQMLAELLEEMVKFYLAVA